MKLIKKINKILRNNHPFLNYLILLSGGLVSYSYNYPNVFDFVWVNIFLLLSFLLQLLFELTPRNSKSFIPLFCWGLLLMTHATLSLLFLFSIPEQAEIDSWVKKLLALINMENSGCDLVFFPAINFCLFVIVFILVVFEIYYFDFGSNNPLNNTDIQIIFIAFVLITFLL